ncbi:MAG: hypothetical protein HY220_04175 [Candidatus Sungbacteria bacterium]|uniref:Uncharacterized protein n=1 Tax=Candidatus Sungiibacteriota bacterium TaxID=2750080 RepID=A0A9D6LRV7_9BACT|nr:hypothetical protein [Candidatus Sungbacteria bacterium]
MSNTKAAHRAAFDSLYSFPAIAGNEYSSEYHNFSPMVFIKRKPPDGRMVLVLQRSVFEI